MIQTILFANGINRRKAQVKTIDYILAAPAAIAIGSFIDGFKGENAFLNFGRKEFSMAMSLVTLRTTAEVIAEYRTIITNAINELKEG